MFELCSLKIPMGWRRFGLFVVLGLASLVAIIIPLIHFFGDIALQYGGIIEDYEATGHIHVITPTYRTPGRELHILRLASQLALVPNLTWFIVEDDVQIDSFIDSKLRWIVTDLRERFGRNSAAMSDDGFSYHYMYAGKRVVRKRRACRGMEARFYAVNVLFNEIQQGSMPHGTLMFLDDDNVYSYHLLADLRQVRKISIWSGANFMHAYFNFPLVSKADNQTIHGMYDAFSSRKFPVDMANFAISTQFAMARLPKYNPASAWQPKQCSHGELETRVLEGLGLQEWLHFAPGYYNGTRVSFWHTRTAFIAVSLSNLKTLWNRISQSSMHERLKLLMSILKPLNPYEIVQDDIQLVQ